MRAAISLRAAASASTARSWARCVARAAANPASASWVSVRRISRSWREITSRSPSVSARACSLCASASRASASATRAAATPTAASALATAASARLSCAFSSAVSITARTSPGCTRSPSRTPISATLPAKRGVMSIRSASIRPLPRAKPSGGRSEGLNSTVHAPKPSKASRATSTMEIEILRDMAILYCQARSAALSRRRFVVVAGHGRWRSIHCPGSLFSRCLLLAPCEAR
jgi:hypothetical protein